MFRFLTMIRKDTGKALWLLGEMADYPQSVQERFPP
jgi:hypothetical protein